MLSLSFDLFLCVLFISSVLSEVGFFVFVVVALFVLFLCVLLLDWIVSGLSLLAWPISSVPDQNGVSLLYIMLEIHHSGWEPSIYALAFADHLRGYCEHNSAGCSSMTRMYGHTNRTVSYRVKVGEGYFKRFH